METGLLVLMVGLVRTLVVSIVTVLELTPLLHVTDVAFVSHISARLVVRMRGITMSGITALPCAHLLE